MEALNCSPLHESGVKLGTSALRACSSELPAHFFDFFYIFFSCKMGYPHLYLQCTYLDVQYTSVSKVLRQPAWLDAKNKSGAGVQALAGGVHGYAVDLKGDVTRSAGSGESFAEKPR